MDTKCVEIDAGGHLVDVGQSEAVSLWREGGGPFWIDVESTDLRETAEFLTALGLDEELVERFLEPGHAARVLPLDDVVFFEFPVQISGQPPEPRSIAFVCLERLVVTIHGDIRLPGQKGPSILRQLVVHHRSTAALVVAQLLGWSIELRRLSSEARKTVLALAEELERGSGAVTLDDILDARREVIDLDAIGEERGAVLDSLEHIKRPFLDLTRHADEFRVVLSNTSATTRRLDRLDRRTQDLQARYDSIQQDKTNRRLSRLTIISAIFLPLTLIAGIYGMNFDFMPELHLRLAYPVVIVGMILIALGLLWWFRSRGWKD